MIKTLIKHKIGEAAIDVLFKQFSVNFNAEVIPQFKLGCQYSMIETQRSFDHGYVVKNIYNNCRIISITDNKVEFKFHSASQITTNPISNVSFEHELHIIANHTYVYLDHITEVQV